ncbi:crustacean hyperglycemic hormone-like [Palaemon carinicauda]|uniref:crustacean hyperglycemic hormone-like n=1 Tax=Palaemon carinicauda TaxID=392227 RepID=UPI0035B5F4B1
MICNIQVWSLLLAAVISVATTNQIGAVSADAPSEVEMLLSPPSDAQPPSALEPLGGHSAEKRAVFDMSCRGVYDWDIFMVLDRVCEDCYNLYRKPYVGVQCRKRCYRNNVFRQCLSDLQLKDNFDSYAASVRTVGK